MGRTGRTPNPENIVRLYGNPGKRPIRKDLRPELGLPEVPSWLPDEAKAEWARIAPELNRLGLLCPLDRAVLAAYCHAWTVFTRTGKLLQDEGVVVPDKAHSGTKKHPAWAMHRESSNLLMALARELGLSPLSRARMKAPEIQDMESAAHIHDLLD